MAGIASQKDIADSQKNNLIAYYISSHGYGHGVRSCAIIRALNELYPHLQIQIVSGLPFDFLDSQIDTCRNPVRSSSFDVGMTQIDSIRMDIPATLEKVKALYSRRKELVETESDYLETHRIGLCVVDIPAIPIEAATTVGIPTVAVGNFGWDWIYSEFMNQDADWGPIINILREEYAKTDLLLRLPFCDSMNAFHTVEDIPLVASPGEARREEIAAWTGSDPAKRWILLSFTTLGWKEEALRRVECISDYEFFTVDPLRWNRGNIHLLDRRRMMFADILASMDAVISKPGFGILSDCIANRKPLIYADRSNFMEYPILVDAIEKYIQHVHIPAARLYSGDLEECLDRIWRSPKPATTIPFGGDRIAAHRIARFL